MQIIFVDTNRRLADALYKACTKERLHSIGFICGSVLEPCGVIVTASNTDFTMGGGWDACVKRWYPSECARVEKGINQRIGNVIFTITVDKNLRATENLVREALRFALDNVKDNETLLLTGLGTGIGGLSEELFIKIFLQEVSK